jgi:hypothetical protein
MSEEKEEKARSVKRWILRGRFAELAVYQPESDAPLVKAQYGKGAEKTVATIGLLESVNLDQVDSICTCILTLASTNLLMERILTL